MDQVKQKIAFEIRFSPPNLSLSDDLNEKAVDYVDSLLTANFGRFVGQYKFLMGASIEDWNTSSIFGGFCEPTLSEMAHNSSVSSYCGKIESTFTLHSAPSTMLEYIVPAACRNLVNYHQPYGDLLRLDFAGPNVDIGYVGWRLESPPNTSFTLDLDAIALFETTAIDFVHNNIKTMSISDMMGTKIETVSENLTIVEAVLFGTSPANASATELLLHNFWYNRTEFLDRLQSTNGSHFDSLSRAIVFRPHLPKLDVARPTSAQPLNWTTRDAMTYNNTKPGLSPSPPSQDLAALVFTIFCVVWIILSASLVIGLVLAVEPGSVDGETAETASVSDSEGEDRKPETTLDDVP